MNNQEITQQLSDINQKLDLISNELEIVRQKRIEKSELQKDLTIVAKELFDTTVVEMEEIAPFVNTGDFLHLVKKILRNTQNISLVITKFESLLDFVEDSRPVTKELFNDVLINLNELDQKGYFVFLKELIGALDRIVDHFSVDDVRQLSDNVTTILETVKSMTQPEILNALDNAVTIYKNLDPKDIQEVSVWKLIRELNKPEMKRGIGFVMSFFKSITAEQSSKQLD
ncbi:DUF1641 domain-containing protein [Candidatus Neomarinimicrobiota bacterium]